MNDKTQVVGTTTQINYQFTAIPVNFIYLFDNYTYKLLATLMQKESFWKNQNKLDDDGFFFIRMDDINFAMNSNKNEINLTIEALHRCGVITVKSNGWVKGQRKTNKYKLNWNKIDELSKLSFQEIFDNGLQITKCKRGEKCTYITVDEVSTQVSTKVSTQVSTNCDPTINNIDNIKNINDINNNIYNNINDNNILDNSTFDKVEDNEQIDDNTFSTSNFLNNDNTTISTSNVEEIECDETNTNNALQIEVKEANADVDTNNTNVIQYDKRIDNTSTTSTISKQEVITKYYQKMDDYNNRMYNATNLETYYYINEQMTKLLQKALDNSSIFSDKQWDLLAQKSKHFEKLQQSKYNYFNGGKKTPTAEEQHNEMMQQYYAMF